MQVVIAVGAIGAVTATALAVYLVNRHDPNDDVSYFVVKRGPLTIDVSEYGTIQNRDQEVVKCQVEGRTDILWIIPEGNQVKAGDLLIQLDSSSLEDQLQVQKITVVNSGAALIRATENLAVAESQGKSDTKKAQLDANFAEMDINKYVDGDYPDQLLQAQADIDLANEELKRAQEQLRWSKTLYDERYITETEYKADELAAKRKDQEHKLAISRKDLLEQYTNVRQLEQLKSDVEQAHMALERVNRRVKADVIQAEADLTARQSDANRQEERMDKLETQIANCEIRAPVGGMVVYSTTGKASWHSNVEPLEEGQQVRERQDLIYLPTTSSMKGDIMVHESSVRMIHKGMPVEVTVEEMPGRVFMGRVDKIGLLPDAMSMRMNPDLKVFETTIILEGTNGELSAGRTCRARIIVAEYKDAIYVPVQCVVRAGGQHVVYVQGPGGYEQRPVTVGMDNNRMIHVLEGLQEGEKVMLSPPLSSSVAPAGRVAPEEDVGQAGPQSRPAADANGGPSATSRPDFRNLSPEERRKRLESLTPEQRQRMMERRGRRSGTGQGGPPQP